LAVKETVWSNMQNSLHQNLPTQFAKVFRNLEIMQYQYLASNQYWKTATKPLRFWLLKKQFGQTNNHAVPILGQ
jgi:hypothetical protein